MRKQGKTVPHISQLTTIRRTADGRLQASVICTDEAQTYATGTVLRSDGGLERCQWLPSGKCYHDDSGRYDLDFSPFTASV